MKARILSLILVVVLAFGCASVLASCGDCEHANMGEWVKVDDNTHQRTCADCGKVETANHKWANVAGQDTTAATLNQKCSCGATRTIDNEDYDAWQTDFDSLTYPWEETTLKMSVNDNSNAKELESGGKAFVSGEWTSDLVRAGETISSVDSGILKQIKERNATAETQTNVKIIYQYQESGAWGTTMPIIATSTASDGTPDIWYDIIYDMVGASIKGYFANIQGNDYIGCFWDSYDDTKDAHGYNFQYMQGLTFSTKITYLVASDYSFDLSRAYLIMPVSIKLLGNATTVTGDADNDGEEGTIDDFFAMVNNGEWTWSKILEYTNAVKKEDSTKGGYAVKDSDCIAGIAMSCRSGMSTTAALYTSSMQVVNRVIDETTGEYVYSYPDEAPTSLVDAGNLFYNIIGMPDGDRDQLSNKTGTSGVIVYRSSAADTLDMFTSNRVLVDSTVMLGSIEKKQYQDMWDEDNGSMGFAVAPVAKLTKENQYQTTIHNIGKVFAVSAKCENVDAACAYINYNSTTSTDILEEYYEWVIGYGRAVTEANVEIIMNMKSQLIYSHDKVVEDALGLLHNSEQVDNPVGAGTVPFGDTRWHTFLLKYWNGNQMSTLYSAVKDNKEAKLLQLQTDFINNAQLEDAQ